MSKLSYEEKIKLIRGKLGKTPSERITEGFAKQAIFDKKKKELADETKKANEEAEAVRIAIHEAKEERARVTQLKLKDAAVKLKKRSESLAIRESEERKVREVNARNWVEHWKWEHIFWTRRRDNAVRTNKDFDKIGKEPINPTAHWFDSNWIIKPQFKEYYD